MPNRMTPQECADHIRRQAAERGQTLEEFVWRINHATREDVAAAMELLPTDALEWAVRFEALSHHAELDPLEILDSLAKSCTRAEDAAFWILTSAAAHLQGFEDDEGSTADAFYWNRVFPRWGWDS
jgi:hypothetical protein